MKKVGLCCLLGVMHGFASGEAFVPSAEVRVGELVSQVREQLLKGWDVLGILRSITIQPPYRTRYIQGVVDDMADVLDHVIRLSCYCEMSPHICRSYQADFEDLGDCFLGFKDAFHAVCTPLCGGEERVIERLLGRATMVFSDCWADALKRGSDPKTDK